jgi:predicted small secreted protein
MNSRQGGGSGLAFSGARIIVPPDFVRCRGRRKDSGHIAMKSTSLRMRPSPLLAVLLLAAGAALAGCNTDSTGAPAVQAAAPKAPITHRQAALDCWMATEHGRADLPLDKRADIVDQCIKDKMEGKAMPKDVSEKAKAGKLTAKPKAKPQTTAAAKPKS